MTLQENISLKPFNTFHIEARARYFAAFSNTDELLEMVDSSRSLFILGGGSNILLTKDYDGLILKNEIRGISLLHEDNEYVYVKAGGGENWHEFVLYCIAHNWSGLENLSLIPGTVGASPIQNIGAYGVELEDVFWSLEALHLAGRTIVTFTKADCQFGYRNSIFKNKFKDQFVISSVTLRLKKVPVFHTSYGAIEQELSAMGVKELSIKAISDAVIRIRSSKLPDPAVIGNAGSFFKNPVVSAERFGHLQKLYPAIVGYPLTNGNVKIAAGWLVENCGPTIDSSWKGYRKGDAGVNEKQALVLVNYGQASGQDILSLSKEIMKTVRERFLVDLEREVSVVG